MAPPRLARPLTLDPVLARLADRPCSRALDRHGARCLSPGCHRAVAEAIGKSRRQVHRLLRDGLTVPAAEQIAVMLATHPAELWGVAVWNAALEEHDAFLDRDDDDSLEELDEVDVAFALEVLA